MAGDYGIQNFHDSGSWQGYGAYRRMPLEEAMRAAAEFAQNLHASPLGVRVTGPKGWVSDRIGGRQEITLIHNPLTDVWTVGCTKCSCTEESTDSYDPVRFARRHQC